MSETYPQKEPSRNAFRKTYTLQRRIRLQRYRKFTICARKNATFLAFLAKLAMTKKT